MAGLLSFTRNDAAALPLTPEGIAIVIAATRRAILARLGLAVAISAALLLLARATGGMLSLAFAGLGLLSLWGVLAGLLAAWDHARASAALRRHIPANIARESDPVKFWRAYRGLFPYSWS
ncbi:hypothetical protein [Sinisalibacter aestuarii]|uniref:Uncharacterized protein n=1 Tax=Sinisalibacter aestuarii TaxID=2949426 RepID=A0ABQ5LP10_9RHOB|nr:hypothetical protein [Sinisalibacter aestuarii]GKY86735.1 hypothetical protein STA1M1_06040 [Sinisalibacter aestuarii]